MDVKRVDLSSISHDASNTDEGSNLYPLHPYLKYAPVQELIFSDQDKSEEGFVPEEIGSFEARTRHRHGAHSLDGHVSNLISKRDLNEIADVDYQNPPPEIASTTLPEEDATEELQEEVDGKPPRTLYAISVLKRRGLKMKKHKHRKRLKLTRIVRRRRIAIAKHRKLRIIVAKAKRRQAKVLFKYEKQAEKRKALEAAKNARPGGEEGIDNDIIG